VKKWVQFSAATKKHLAVENNIPTLESGNKGYVVHSSLAFKPAKGNYPIVA
jgi:hypothetical protein